MPPLRHRFWRWFYNTFAFTYDPVLKIGERLRLGGEERIRRELFAATQLPPRSIILDIGCGTGALVPHLPTGAFYVGIDASLAMLRRARRKHPNRAFLLADVASLPVASLSTHLAVAMGVLQHTADPAACIAQLRRVANHRALIDEHHAHARIQAAIPRPSAAKSYKDYFVLFF